MLPSEASPKLSAYSGTGLRLFLLGFFTLFLELFFIRFLASSIWNLGFFPNLVLLSAFIGIGIGFVFHNPIKASWSEGVFLATFMGAATLILLVSFKHPIVPGFDVWHYNLSGDLYFSYVPFKVSDHNYIFFILCFVAIALIFAGFSQCTAKVFAKFTPLHAYTLDILGSCGGILLFIAVSALRLPAWSWFAILGILFASVMQSSLLLRALPILVTLMTSSVMAIQDHKLMRHPTSPYLVGTTWSPYQKVEYVEEPGPGNILRRRIFVNGLDNQEMHAYPEALYYNLPYVYRKHMGLSAPKNVLIFGAGSGNDVTTAIRNGATHVDAVEIDPVIASLGRKHHPSGAYRDLRVEMHITDGRAFMTQTKRKYDLIIFALTDSLVKVSSLSQLRLENYLFTKESVQKAYSLLNEQGNIVFYNYYRLPFVAQKIYNMTYMVTGIQPKILAQQNDFFMLCGEKKPGAIQLPQVAHLGSVQIPTDDWPFLYLQERGIPKLYLQAIAGVLVLIIVLLTLLQFITAKKAVGQGTFLLKLAFIFMGIAFLLLETKSIIQFSLLFGTTWLNNSLIFLAILILVLMANWTTQFLKITSSHLWILYTLLAISVGASLVYPLHNLLTIERIFLRFIAASFLTLLPIYFANLIFSTAFKEQVSAEHLFGWNLIGATFGGVLEYTGMAIGYNHLSFIVLACYTLVFCFLLKVKNCGLSASPESGQEPKSLFELSSR